MSSTTGAAGPGGTPGPAGGRAGGQTGGQAGGPSEEAEAFAELLRGLKERSGLSYGALAKRLHMSTSTLHRYCNGSAVPNDYAPVERFARVCRADREEVVELHRRWILADAARGRTVRQESAPAPAPDSTAPAAPLPDEPLPGHPQHSDPQPGDPQPDEPLVEGPGASAPSAHPALAAPPSPARPGRRRRTSLIAMVAAASALGAVVLAVNLPFSGDNGDNGADGQAAGATAAAAGAAPAGGGNRPSVTSPSPSASSSPSASRSTGQEPQPSQSASRSGAPADGAGASDGGGTDGAGTGVPVHVATRPYVYDNPCSQHFLVDSDPQQVGPPATEPEALGWASAYGAVASGQQRVALTVQGTGKDTVVLEALHVRVVTKDAPLAWNDYSMGVGCGGSVETKSFDVDLDNGSPFVTVRNGQRDFPYKVSESDPEVFYVTAHAKAHDVRWDLTLDWSSGDRHGTLHVDNAGKPFRTSADAGRPGYDYPLGSSEWIKRENG